MLKNYIKRNKLFIIGAFFGLIFGFTYWYFTDNANTLVNCLIWGAILFSVVFGYFKKKDNSDKKEE